MLASRMRSPLYKTGSMLPEATAKSGCSVLKATLRPYQKTITITIVMITITTVCT